MIYLLTTKGILNTNIHYIYCPYKNVFYSLSIFKGVWLVYVLEHNTSNMVFNNNIREKIKMILPKRYRYINYESIDTDIYTFLESCLFKQILQQNYAKILVDKLV
jgi:hypothetical protein